MTAKRKLPPKATHPPSVDWSLAEASRLKECALAQLRQFELQVKRHEVLHLDVIRPMWSRIIVGLRNAMLSIPTKLRLRMPHLSAQDLLEIEETIRDVLTEASLERGFTPTPEDADDDDG